MRIYESDMVFGDFNEADCFHIEQTDIRKRLASRGVKSVEFVLSQPMEKRILFVEAKSTLPSANNIERFEEEINDISQKFMDSLSLTCGIWFGSHNSEVTAPDNREQFFSYGTQIVFILVIKSRKRDLPHIEDMIKRQLLRERIRWGFDVLAMNEDEAREANLVC